MTAEEPILDNRWPAIPASVAAARRAVATTLQEHETPDPPLSDISLVVSEAVTNAIIHAFVDRDPGQFRVRVSIDGEIEIIVEDDGRGMAPRPDSPGMGLGLPLIATLTQRFDIRAGTEGGTRVCAWFQRGTPPA